MKNDPRPPKPYETFPLAAHRRGYWYKKIDGKQKPFGKWAWPDLAEYEASWKAAKEAFEKFDEARAMGRHVVVDDLGQLTIGQIVDAYLEHQENRATGKVPEITSAHWFEQKKILTKFRDYVGREKTVIELEEFDPARPDACLIKRWIEHVRGKYGWCAFNKRMTVVAGLWIWTEHPVTGILKRPYRLRMLLERRGDRLRKKEKDAKTAQLGKQRWTPDELRALFHHAPPILRSMMELQYILAWGNSDLSDVPASAVEFEPEEDWSLPDAWAVADWRRPKTQIDRAGLIPPEIVARLKEAIKMRPKPMLPEWDNRLFLTSLGRPWVRSIVHKKPVDPENPEAGEMIDRVVKVDAFAGEFAKLRDRLSKCETHGWFATGIHRGTGSRTDIRRKKGEKIEKAAKRPKAMTKCPKCGEKMKPMRKLGAYTFRHTAVTYASVTAEIDVLHLYEGHAVPGIRRRYLEEVEVHGLKLIAEKLLQKLHSRPTEKKVIRNASASETPSSEPASSSSEDSPALASE